MRLFGHTVGGSVSIRGGRRLLVAGNLVVAACDGVTSPARAVRVP